MFSFSFLKETFNIVLKKTSGVWLCKRCLLRLRGECLTLFSIEKGGVAFPNMYLLSFNCSCDIIFLWQQDNDRHMHVLRNFYL